MDSDDDIIYDELDITPQQRKVIRDVPARVYGNSSKSSACQQISSGKPTVPKRAADAELTNPKRPAEPAALKLPALYNMQRNKTPITSHRIVRGPYKVSCKSDYVHFSNIFVCLIFYSDLPDQLRNALMRNY